MKAKEFYTYVYLDPRNDEPIYVGKGFGWRYKRHLSPHAYNLHLRNRIIAIRRDGLEPVIGVFSARDEAEAFEFEKLLIAAFGRRDKGTGTLCNYTDGGDGESGRYGFKHSEETKARIRKKLMGREMTVEHRSRIGASRKGHVNGEESRRKAAESRKRNDTPERAAARSLRAKNSLHPEHQRRMTEKARAVNLGKPMPDTTHAALAKANRERRTNVAD